MHRDGTFLLYNIAERDIVYRLKIGLSLQETEDAVSAGIIQNLPGIMGVPIRPWEAERIDLKGHVAWLNVLQHLVSGNVCTSSGNSAECTQRTSRCVRENKMSILTLTKTTFPCCRLSGLDLCLNYELRPHEVLNLDSTFRNIYKSSNLRHFTDGFFDVPLRSRQVMDSVMMDGQGFFFALGLSAFFSGHRFVHSPSFSGSMVLSVGHYFKQELFIV